MKALVVYDSKFGNTRSLAEAIGHQLETFARRGSSPWSASRRRISNQSISLLLADRLTLTGSARRCVNSSMRLL